MTTPVAKFDPLTYAASFKDMADENEKARLWSQLSNTQKKKVTKELDVLNKADEAIAEGSDSEDSDVPMPTPTTTIASKSVKGKGKSARTKIEISDVELSEMWTSIDKQDVTLIDEDSLRIFEYEGFNPDLILRSLMVSKKRGLIADDEFLRDILIMCGVAIIKGTVNDNNYKKMQKAGQDAFMSLEAKYSISRGSGKGQAGDVVTIARVAAAFPGKVIQLLQNKKVAPREYISKLKTHGLPPLMRHQALAACIPRDLKEEVREFILGLITAFSVDQSMVISAKKPELLECIKSQNNFTRVSFGGKYPSDKVRKAIFSQYNWVEMFPKLLEVGKVYAKANDDFNVIELADLKAAINAL